MGQKVSPIAMRVPIRKDWKSRWFGFRNYTKLLKEDVAIREILTKRLRNLSVDRVEIERNSGTFSIIIYTSRPGLIIGKGGNGIEELKKLIQKTVRFQRKTSLRIEIQEVKNPETSAHIMAESMAEQIEKRIPYRRLLKQTLAKIAGNRDVKGVKIAVAGRLDGNDIARTEHLEQGNLPLQTLRANIDYARATAHTTYGTVGIKVWIFKGLEF
jgi:small subunit ribosomal protein S3